MNNTRMTHRVGALLGALAFAAAFTAEAASDKSFVKDAAKDNHFEVQAGQLAEKQGNSEMVRNLGKQIAADHQKATQELQKVATDKKFEAPSEPANKRDLDKLAKKTGADFDKDYVNLMVKDHKKDIKMYEKQAKDSKDAEVKKYAEENIAVLQKHLQMSEQTQAALKQGTAVGGGARGERKSNNK